MNNTKTNLLPSLRFFFLAFLLMFTKTAHAQACIEHLQAIFHDQLSGLNVALISDDGSTVLVNGYTPNFEFKYYITTNSQPLVEVPGINPNAISANGRYLAGGNKTGGGYSIWDKNTNQLQSISLPSGSQSVSDKFYVTDDGKVIGNAFYGYDGPYYIRKVFRWSNGVSILITDARIRLYDVSRNGDVMIGNYEENPLTGFYPVRWTQASGTWNNFDGIPTNHIINIDNYGTLSPNGNFITGTASVDEDQDGQFNDAQQAFRWSPPDNYVTLGPASVTQGYSQGFSIFDDGTIIGQIDEGGPYYSQRHIWEGTATTSSPLKNYLLNRGVMDTIYLSEIDEQGERYAAANGSVYNYLRIGLVRLNGTCFSSVRIFNEQEFKGVILQGGMEQNVTIGFGGAQFAELYWSADGINYELVETNLKLQGGGVYYNWLVPPQQVSAGYLKAVAGSAEHIVGPFSIISPYYVINPSSYIKWITGEKEVIKWTETNWLSTNIKCVLNFGTPQEQTIKVEEGILLDSAYYQWDIPDTLLSYRSKIIIENGANPNEKIESGIFRIKPYVLTRLNADSTYYEYRKNRDQWGFSNIPKDMWDSTWYNQFNYQGNDPFTGLQYSQWQGFFIFANAKPSEHVDWISWVNTFSEDACYWNVNMGIYNLSALLQWKAHKNSWNGSCFGIATANALAFSHKELFQNKYPLFPNFNDPIVVGSDNNVKKVVNELFNFQWGNPHFAHTTANWLTRTPNQTLNDLKNMLKEDDSKASTISIWNNNGNGGHNILAYGLKQDSTFQDIHYVQVYDNAYPNLNNPIIISSSANGGNGGWVFNNWPGWGGAKKFILMDEAIGYLQNSTLPKNSDIASPFLVSASEVQIFNKPGNDIFIKNNQGESIGYVNGNILENLQAGVPLVPLNGSETPPIGYSLPIDNYSIELSEFAEDTLEAFFFTGNKSFSYERYGVTQTQTDRLFFDGGVSAVNPDEETKTIKLLNIINETTQEKLCIVRAIELAQNDSVKIENTDSNKVKLISYGSAKDYDIELNYVTENGLGRFRDFGIQLTANTSHTFIPVWTDLTNTDLQVLVDIGNDGTIDDTLSLINQITGIGDDQGALLTPNSFNLAQNYPNPFNPTTTIRYQIPIDSHVSLKVYDLLGNEVATIVDEYREAGSYAVEFNAMSLSSGVYFYTLKAGSFVETKKMILLR